MAFGAGTVTSLEMLELAKKSGAQFIVSPDTNEEIIKATVAGGMVSMPGALTPTEILNAHRYGADFVKVFPTASLGTTYIKAVKKLQLPFAAVLLKATIIGPQCCMMENRHISLPPIWYTL